MTIKNLLLVSFILNFAIGSQVFSQDLCKNPSQKNSASCAQLKFARNALENQNYGEARKILNDLKSKMTLDDPLASEVSEISSKIPKMESAPIVKPAEIKPSEPSRLEAKPTNSLAFRNSDGFRIRSTWEMANLYALEGTHAIISGIAFSTLNSNREDKKLLLYLGMIGTGAVTILGTTFYLDRFGDKLRYGVPSGYAFGYVAGIGTAIATSYLIHAYRKNDPNGQRVGHIENVYQRTLAISSTVGGLAGGLLAHSFELRPGQSAFIASTGLWGAGLGMSTGGSFIDPHRPFVSKLTGWGTLIGNISGLAAGSLIVGGTDFSPSTPRVLLMNAGYFGGLLSAFYILGSSTDHDNTRRNRNLAIASLSGGVIGLGTAALLTSWMRPDTLPLRESSEQSWLDRFSFGIVPNEENDLVAQVALTF